MKTGHVNPEAKISFDLPDTTVAAVDALGARIGLGRNATLLHLLNSGITLVESENRGAEINVIALSGKSKRVTF